MFFIADLIACSTCFGHHYAHHQELEGIIHLVAACGLWCLVFKLSVWCGAEGCVSSLRAAAAESILVSGFKMEMEGVYIFLDAHKFRSQ
jgi:hypothetical protein